MNQDILISLIDDNILIERIVTDFPILYSPILTLKTCNETGYNQTAINKIINFYNTNEKFKLFIDDIIKNKKTKIESNIINDDENDVSGMVLIIDKKEESYKKLMLTAKKEKWKYKGLSIIEEFNNLRIYFY